MLSNVFAYIPGLVLVIGILINSENGKHLEQLGELPRRSSPQLAPGNTPFLSSSDRFRKLSHSGVSAAGLRPNGRLGTPVVGAVTWASAETA